MGMSRSWRKSAGGRRRAFAPALSSNVAFLDFSRPDEPDGALPSSWSRKVADWGGEGEKVKGCNSGPSEGLSMSGMVIQCRFGVC